MISYINSYINRYLENMKETCVNLSVVAYDPSVELVFEKIPKLELYPNLYFWLEFKVVDHQLMVVARTNDTIAMPMPSYDNLVMDSDFGKSLRDVVYDFVQDIHRHELEEITRYIKQGK